MNDKLKYWLAPVTMMSILMVGCNKDDGGPAAQAPAAQAPASPSTTEETASLTGPEEGNEPSVEPNEAQGSDSTMEVSAGSILATSGAASLVMAKASHFEKFIKLLVKTGELSEDKARELSSDLIKQKEQIEKLSKDLEKLNLDRKNIASERLGKRKSIFSQDKKAVWPLTNALSETDYKVRDKITEIKNANKALEKVNFRVAKELTLKLANFLKSSRQYLSRPDGAGTVRKVLVAGGGLAIVTAGGIIINLFVSDDASKAEVKVVENGAEVESQQIKAEKAE